jgi:hypothetical protein
LCDGCDRRQQKRERQEKVNAKVFHGVLPCQADEEFWATRVSWIVCVLGDELLHRHQDPVYQIVEFVHLPISLT